MKLLTIILWTITVMLLDVPFYIWARSHGAKKPRLYLMPLLGYWLAGKIIKEKLRVWWCHFRGIPPYTIEQVLERAREAMAAGRFEFDHPSAEQCFPISGSEEPDLGEQPPMTAAMDSRKQFTYVQMEVLKPFKPKWWKSERVKSCAHEGGIYFRWGIKSLGFGDASVVMRNGKWICQSEGLGKEFMKDALAIWVDQMEEK